MRCHAWLLGSAVMTPRMMRWRHLGRASAVVSVAATLLLVAPGNARAQGSVVGWGHQVVRPQEEMSDLTAVGAGLAHSLGLRADGSIVAWGRNETGECNVPEPNTGFVAVAAGGGVHHPGGFEGEVISGYSLGLKADGSIVAWGDNISGQCNVPEPNQEFVTLAAGSYHSLALKADSSIVAWGGNEDGQCNVPEPNTGFVAVAAGGAWDAWSGGGGHSLGLKANGSVVAWGANGWGQSTVPEPNTGFVAVAAGSGHSLGLKSDGSIVAWGNNDWGQCTVPEPNAGFVALAARSGHSLALKSDGSIVVWGNDECGQCNVPEPNTGFVAAAAGGGHCLGLKLGGALVGWGCGDHAQCGAPGPNTGFVAVTSRGGHSLALREDGSVAAWGWNTAGECNVPDPNVDFVEVAAGGLYRIDCWHAMCRDYADGHSLGLKANGSIVAWGRNNDGQCDVPEPNADFVAVAAGGAHSLGLKGDGSIVAWGSNRDGQCSVPEPNTGFVAIEAGDAHSLGLKGDGLIVAWGRNNEGQCDLPEPNEGCVAVAAGGWHNLALKSDGSVVAWGSNGDGQCNVPEPNACFVAIAAGGFLVDHSFKDISYCGHSVGLKEDGSIVAWGRNDWDYFGQSDVPEPNEGFSLIAAGGTHSLALKGRSAAAVDDEWIRRESAVVVAPNPFTTSTRILYAATTPVSTRLSIYDVSGRCVRMLERGGSAAGQYQVEWDGRDDDGRAVPAGIYLVRVSVSEGSTLTRVMMIR